MRTGPLAGRSAKLLYAEVAFGRLEDGFGVGPGYNFAFAVAYLDHSDRIVRAVIETGLAANASDWIDDDFAACRAAVNRAGGTTNQADWVRAMHASVGHHEI